MTVETLPGTVHEALTLTITFRESDCECVLSLGGALTAETIGAFENPIDRLGRTTFRRVVLEVGGLTDLDDAGARMLTGLHHYVQGRGGHLTVRGAGAPVARALAATPVLAG